MPLDSPENRASAVSLTQSAPPTPTPNAAMDQEWRQESGWGYAALLVGEPVIPPVIPPVEEVAAGSVWVYPTIDRRVFVGWQREVFNFWVRYFEEILQLTEAQARLRATEIMKAADTVNTKKPTKSFWKAYFVRAEEMKHLAYAIELDDEEILSLL
jgi:hypothetical protein